MTRTRLILPLLFLATLCGCAPLVIGAGGAVLADQVVEDQKGCDGLF